MQSVYHQLGPAARAFHINTFKHLRPILQQQREHLKDGPFKEKLLTFSPALYPDRPDAPPDLPEATRKILDSMSTTINLQAAANGGVRKPPRLVDGWFHPDDLMPHLGFVRAGSSTGQAARHADLKRVRILAEDDDGGCGDSFVEDHNGNLRRPRKRSRYGYEDGSSDGDSDDDNYSDISAEPINPSRFSPSGSESDEFETSFGAPPRRPRKPRLTARRLRHERHWHNLPYEERLDKLGPGMSRDDRRIGRNWARGVGRIENPFALSFEELVRAISGGDGDDDDDDDDDKDNYDGMVSDDADELPPDPRDPPGAPYATWEEAMREAPDDYMHLKSYFLWEKRHKRRAPAVLNRSALPYLPFRPVFPHPSAEAYNGFLPDTGPEGPDDEMVSISGSDDSDDGDGDGGDGDGGEGHRGDNDNVSAADGADAGASASIAASNAPDASASPAAPKTTITPQTSPSALRVISAPILSVASIASSASSALNALVSRQPRPAARQPIVWRPGVARDVNDGICAFSVFLSRVSLVSLFWSVYFVHPLTAQPWTEYLPCS